MKKIYIIILTFLLFNNGYSQIYWDNRVGDNLWSTAGNWSTGAIPTKTDNVIFDGDTSTADCYIDVAMECQNLTINADYDPGVVYQAANITIWGSFSMPGATFMGNIESIICKGTFSISGGSFTSTSDVLTIWRNFNLTSGSFSHNGGTVIFNTNNNVLRSITINDGPVFNNLTLQAYATDGTQSQTAYTFTVEASTTVTVAGSLEINSSANTTYDRAIIINTGTIDHTGTGFSLTGLSDTIAGGGTGTIKLSGTTSITGRTNATYAKLCNVEFAGSTRTIAVTNYLNVGGTLSMSGAGSLTINTGTIIPRGAVTITNSGTAGGGTSTLSFEATGDQTLTGSGTAGNGKLPKVTINKSSGAFTLASILSVANDFTFTTAGSTAVAGSTLACYGSMNLDGQGTSTTMSFNNVDITSGTVTLAGNLDVNGNFSIGGTLVAGSYTITDAGNWTNNGTFTANTSNVTFDGATGQYLTGTNDAIQTFNNLTISGGTKLRIRPRIPVTVSGTLLVNGGTDSLSVLASASGSTVYTGSLLIGGTFTNNGMIGFRTAILKNQWHCISSPVATAAVGTIFSDVPNGNFYYYDETVSSGFWTSYTSGNMTVGKGYYTYYYSNKFKNLVGGSFNNTDPAPSLTYTPAGRAGWNEVGNPYPCALDVKSTNMDASFTNVNNTIYIKNGANWATYNRATDATTYGGSRYVLPSQGFFVIATSATTFNMPLTARAHNTGASLLKNINSIPSLYLTCFSDSLSSESIMMFINDATENFDGDYDAYKLFSDKVNTPELFTTTLSADTLVVDALPLISTDFVRPLGLKTSVPGTYTINAREIVNFDLYLTVFLEDVAMGIITNLNTDSSYTFDVTDTSFNSTSRFNLRFSFSTPPQIIEQPVSVIKCEGESVQLSVTPNNAQNLSYQWYNTAGLIAGANTNQYSIASVILNDANDYYCVITNQYGTVQSLPATLTVNAFAQISQSPVSTVNCEGETTTLSVVASGTDILYQWQKDGQDIINEVSSSLQFSQLSTANNGNYTCVVTDLCNTLTSDVATITVNTFPVVNLGANQTVCEGTAITLDAGNTGATYLWNDLSTNQLINPLTGGTYSVTVTKDGCTSNASVDITIIPNPVVNLGSDISVCAGILVTLNAGNNGTSYLWSDNSTNQQFVTSVSGTYSVTVTKNGCTSIDEINVTFNSFPVVNLGNNQTVCEGTPVVLDAGNPGLTYLWSNGSTTQLLDVTVGDIYEVTVTNNGCSSSDYVLVNIKPTPVVELGSDISSCEGSVITLDAGYITGNSYIWSNGSHNEFISTAISGVYSVTVTNNGCTGTDQINITVNLNPIVDLGPDLAICSGCTEILDAGNSGSTYIWSTNETTQTIDVTVAGTYIVTVTSSEGCSGIDEIIVDVVSGIETNSVTDKIVLYPNPAVNYITISSTLKGVYNIEVLDIMGKRILSMQTDKNKNELNISNLEKGTYLMRISNSENQFVKALIKQ